MNETKTPSASGAVVLVKSIEEKTSSNSKTTGVIAAGVCSLFLVSQFSFIGSQVLANVSSSSSAPITSPITSPEVSPSTSVEPSQAPSTGNSNPGNSGGGSNNSGGGSPSAPSCNDQAPSSAPGLISAISSGPNSAILTWSGAIDPVTSYAVIYGLKSNTPLYGNPNIGGKFTTAYEVKGLSGNTTYFFKVRAGNNCMPGAYSNEVAVRVSGNKIKYPAQGFIAGVLGAKKVTPKSSSVPQASVKSEVKYEVVNPTTGNVLGSFFSKILSLFGR